MNRPCGKGKAGIYSGTWLDGKGHGICKELYFQIIYNLNIQVYRPQVAGTL